MKKKDETAEQEQQTKVEPVVEESVTLKKIKESVHEGDPKPSRNLSLRSILGGDILSAELLRRQVWLILLVVLFIVIYVGNRYQCQRDLITIDRMERELLDAKYRALSSSSRLTERCRESRVLEGLKANRDSMLQPSDQPPYIVVVPEEE